MTDPTDDLDLAASRSARRLMAVVAAVVVVIGGVVAGVAVRRDHRTSTGPAVAPLATGSVTQGDLTVSDRLDGTLQRTSELTVVHRISGVTPGASSGSGAAGGTGATGGSGTSATLNAARTVSGTGPTADAILTGVTTAESTDRPTATSAAVPSGAAQQDPCPDSATSTTTTTDPGSTSTTTDPSSTTTTTDPASTSSSTEPTTTSTTPAPCPTTTTTGGTGPGGSQPDAGGGAGGRLPSGLGSGAGTGSRVGTGTGAGGQSAAGTPRELVGSIIAAGAAVRSGDVLYSVEGRPVVALTGALPAWRDLDTSASAGPDVQQLEAALAALGYDDGGRMTVDSTYDSHTAAAVTTWQQGLGLTGTGKVPLGWIVFIPETTTVTSVTAAVGRSLADGDAVLKLATPAQQVVVQVPEKLRSVVSPGLTVTVSGTTGKVSRLASGTDANNAVTVVGYVALDKAIAAADGSAVTARFTVTDATNVLLVPAAAVTSRIDGSYAVLAVDEAGTGGTWIPVEVHGVANGQVAVTGSGLRPGLTIAVPG